MEQVFIKSWGNSSAIRLPKNVLNELGLSNSDVLDLEIDGDRIILKKAFQHKTFKERMNEYRQDLCISHLLQRRELLARSFVSK
jgi:antitoxin MazE